MTVIRINKKDRNFLIVYKTCLNQKELSWGAKGLHTYLMGLPDDSQINVSKLKEKSTNGRDAVRGFLNELKNAGYITTKWGSQRIKWEFSHLEYIVHEHHNQASNSLWEDFNPVFVQWLQRDAEHAKKKLEKNKTQGNSRRSEHARSTPTHKFRTYAEAMAAVKAANPDPRSPSELFPRSQIIDLQFN